MNVTMETPSDPEGLVTGNLLSHYMAPYAILGLTAVFRLRTSIYYNNNNNIIIKVYFRPNTEDSEGPYSQSTSHDTCKHRCIK